MGVMDRWGLKAAWTRNREADAVVGRLERAMEDYGSLRYREGLRKGLSVAKTILGWLTEQPDTKRQKRVREMAQKAISRALSEIDEED